jgi:hypothetical protein
MKLRSLPHLCKTMSQGSGAGICVPGMMTPIVGSKSIAMFGNFGLFAVWCYTV